MSQVRGPPIITPTLGVVPGVEWRDAGRGECVFFSTEVTRASNQGGFWIVFQCLLLRWLQLSDNDQAKRGKTIMARNQNNRESSVICDRWRGVARSYCYCYCHCFLLLLLFICIEVWDAVRLPQNTKNSLVIQRVALEGITNAKVNSLNEKKSRISVRLN